MPQHNETEHIPRFEPFDPALGTVVESPPGEGRGYWAGAPGVTYDEHDGFFYLIHRVRRPRGVHPDRGAEIHLSRSRDGIDFETIWTGSKEQLHSASIERCAIRRLGDNRWVLYISYVDPADQRWRIDLCEAPSPDGFDLRRTTPVLTAADANAEGVKDPFVFQVASRYHMIVSFAAATAPASTDDLHSTADAYNTGLIRSATGLATSNDGFTWQWEGEIFGPRETGWDRYCSRIGCVWRQDEAWLALYDGSASVDENYEERVGLAYSFDLRTFHRETSEKPLMTTAQNDGALRYFDVIARPDFTYIYYEMAQADGSHDLRVYRRLS